VADISSRLFSDDGKHLDRFGLVLGLSVLSSSILMLIDLDDPTASVWSEVGWFAVTLIVGFTLIATLHTSGVAPRPRKIIDIFVWFTVGSVLLVAVFDRFTDVGIGIGGAQVGQPSPLWALLALAAPFLVLRRVLMQKFVTSDTLRGAFAVYVLLAVAFNYVFLSVQSLAGDLFFGAPQPTTAFMYFSLATITTVGYGDLSAVTAVGRFFSSAEAVLGQVILVVVVARLVSLYGEPQPKPEPVVPSSAEPVPDHH
jgi:hypothetical protein